MLIKRICLLSILFSLLFLSNAAAQSSTFDSSFTVTSNKRGTEDGYDFEFWKNDKAAGKMEIGDAGTFKCEWSSKGDGSNILFRTGKRFGNSRTHLQIGKITFTYSADYNPKTGVSYMGVYGWTQDPLVEYYVVENYRGSNHPGNYGVKKGSFTIEGEGTYDIYTREMKNAPAIAGPGKYNFTQYISVRTQKRTSGTISVSRHFEEWEKLGLNMGGKLNETMMKVEGYQSSGTATLTENKLTIEK